MSFINHRGYAKRYGSTPGPAPVPAHYGRGIGTYPQAAADGVGGFAIVRDPVLPPGADSRLWSLFVEVDVDRSGSISAQELQRALINGDRTHFDLDTVKLLMSLFDANRSGDIDFTEFSGLWRYIQEWQHAFRQFDRDRSGTIDSSELQSALSRFGLKLPRHLLSLLVAKFASSTAGYEVGEQTITFDRFMRACVFMKRFSDTFGQLPKDRNGYAQLNYDQFLWFCFSLP